LRRKLKTLTVNLGLAVLSLLFIEGLLRTAAFGYSLFQTNRFGFVGTGTKIILCVGESTTAFGFSNSYPSQLQRKLDEAFPKGTYRVINAGVPGTSTTKIAKFLPALLAKYHPYAVITMIGVNDWQIDISTFYSDLRLYKVAKWAWTLLTNRESLENPNPISAVEFEESNSDVMNNKADKDFLLQDYESAESEYADIEKSRPLTSLELWRMAKIKYYIGQSSAGRDYLNKFITENKNSARAKVLAAWTDLPFARDYTYLNLQVAEVLNQDPYNRYALWLKGWYLMSQRKYNEIPATLDPVFVEHPCDPPAVHILRLAYLRTNETEKLKSLRMKCPISINSNGTPDPEKLEESASSSLFMTDEKFKENYLEIAGFIQKAGAVHLVMQYPLQKIEPLKEILKSYPDIIYLSNEKTFEKLFETHKYSEIFSDRFAENFGHATPLGNETIASAVFEEIKLLNGKK
jgi:hypothetical protein